MTLLDFVKNSAQEIIFFLLFNWFIFYLMKETHKSNLDGIIKCNVLLLISFLMIFPGVMLSNYLTNLLSDIHTFYAGGSLHDANSWYQHRPDLNSIDGSTFLCLTLYWFLLPAFASSPELFSIFLFCVCSSLYLFNF